MLLITQHLEEGREVQRVSDTIKISAAIINPEARECFVCKRTSKGVLLLELTLARMHVVLCEPCLSELREQINVFVAQEIRRGGWTGLRLRQTKP